MTLIKAKLCIIALDPFLCHEESKPVWCAGVMDAIEANVEKEPQPAEWKQKLSRKMLDVLSDCEEGKLTEEEAVSRVNVGIQELANEMLA
jgi:hypothetical protein